MEELEILDQSDCDQCDLKTEEIHVENPPIHQSSLIQTKKLHKLEKDLTTVFLDPLDSDHRKRYIRRWIYGEGIQNKDKKYSG